MAEYRFDHPRELSGGRVLFRVENVGQLEHKLSMSRLPDDLTLAALRDRGQPTPLSATASLPVQAPGQHVTFALDLTPGRYVFACFLPGPDGVQHFKKGMSSELVVR